MILLGDKQIHKGVVLKTLCIGTYMNMLTGIRVSLSAQPKLVNLASSWAQTGAGVELTPKRYQFSNL